MHGVSMARHKKFPESKAKGMIGIPPVAIFTSELVCLHNQVYLTKEIFTILPSTSAENQY